jgi:tetratricopeptide (TPR) repeat protein
MKGRSLPYGNVSFSALAEAVKSQAGILEDDPPAEVTAKIDLAVQVLFGDRSMAPHLRALVGTAEPQGYTRQQLFDAWRSFLERIAAWHPTVLALEDMHWADDGLLDFVEHLAEFGHGPIFILAMARPELIERRPGWAQEVPGALRIPLDPLTAGESEEMLDGLLGASLPPTIRSAVVDRAEGNPLFTEEIVRLLIDQGVLTRAGEDWLVTGRAEDVVVPTSIQGLLAARLDALRPEEKEVAQDAAVVGRVFWSGAVARLSGRTVPETLEVLDRLVAKGLVVPRDPSSFLDEPEFSFHHVLIRDVAYEILPKAARAVKHAGVAAWAEEHLGGRAEEMAELLASHYSDSLRYMVELSRTGKQEIEARVFRWSVAAGDHAMRLWQQAEAAKWYERALELADVIHPAPEQLAELWDRFGAAAAETRPYAEVEESHTRARDLYVSMGRVVEAARVEMGLAVMASLAGSDPDVEPWIEAAQARLRPMGATLELAHALEIQGSFHATRGRPDQAEPLLRQAIEIARGLGSSAAATEGHALISLGRVLLDRGRWEEGMQREEAAYSLAHESSDLSLWLRICVELPMALLRSRRDHERGVVILRRGLELARRSGRRAGEAWLLMFLSIHLAEMGRLAEAEAAAALSLHRARGMASTPGIRSSLLELARVRLLRGQRQGAEQLVAEAGDTTTTGDPLDIPYQAMVMGYLAEAQGRDLDALRAYADGVRKARGNLLADKAEEMLFECVRLAVAAGRVEEAGGYRDQLARIALGRTHAEAFLAWAEGLLADDPEEATRSFLAAARGFERLGEPIHQGRSLIAAGEAEAGRELLARCGANLFLRMPAAAG